MKLGYMGIDQYGTTYKLNKYPRKELLEQLYATGASKMYVDTTTGDIKHIGYIITGLWIQVYTINSWKEVAKDVE